MCIANRGLFFSRRGCAWVSGAGPGLEMIGDRYDDLITRLGGTRKTRSREDRMSMNLYCEVLNCAFIANGNHDKGIQHSNF